MSPIKKVRPMPAPAAPPAADQRNTVQPPPAQKAEHRGWDPFDKLEDFTHQRASAAGFTAYAPAGPAPTLRKPLVMITGLTMQASSYDPLSKHLASNSANGAVAVYVASEGRFREGGVEGEPMSAAAVSGAKIFQVQYRNVKGAPSEKAPQIAAAMDAISKATGASDLDVVCHSAGCTDFRLYLQDRAQRRPAVDHAVFIGPASHGTFMGNVGDAVGGIVGLEKAGSELEIGSPLVRSLNERWDGQRDQCAGGVTIIGITGAPTAGQGGLSDGDGFMPIDEVAMPGADTVTLRGADPTPIAHLKEVGYSGVIGVVQRAIASQ